MRESIMTLYLVTWSADFSPDGQWSLSDPIRAQSPMDAAEQAEPDSQAVVRVYPLMTDEWGEPDAYGYIWGKDNDAKEEINR